MDGTTQNANVDPREAQRALKALLTCGILSSVVYLLADLIASARWAGYSYVNQAVSELAAIGAPTRPLMVAAFTLYNLLVVTFAFGVWLAAEKRSIRVAAVMLVVYALVGEITTLFSPMHLRGSQITATDIGHMTLTFIEVLSIVLFIAFGSGARGKGFRIYSVATILALVTAGALVGMQSQEMTAAASSTPLAGALERVNIYSTMLWIAMFASVLLRGVRERSATPRRTEVGGAHSPKRVLALVGSPHKGGATYRAARIFLDDLESLGDVTGELVMLGDYDVKVCRGCKVCFDRGEQFCPLKDDRDALMAKIDAADGVVFASPNYSWGVSGVMKVFLDRLGFVFHRPRYFGKVATSIVVQGMFRGGKIRDYLEFCAGGLGFTVVKGSVMRTLEPMTEGALHNMDKTLAEQSRRFHSQLMRPPFSVPSLFKVALFRMSRSGIRLSASKDGRDFSYYREQGWFESDYYYPIDIGTLKRAAGAFFDWLTAHAPLFPVAAEEPAAVSSGSPTTPAGGGR